MSEKELNEKIALLKDGVTVEIDGLMFRALRMNDENPCWPCLYCNVDCLCRGDVAEVCIELDFLSKSVWYLNLVDNSLD